MKRLLKSFLFGLLFKPKPAPVPEKPLLNYEDLWFKEMQETVRLDKLLTETEAQFYKLESELYEMKAQRDFYRNLSKNSNPF